jgi:ribose-phosphate pyrophosphokinase
MIIDTDNYEASGIKVINFPGGEWHVDVPPIDDWFVHIHAKPRTWDDWGKLLFVLDALNLQQEDGKTRVEDVYLFCPYLPGARQDRPQPGFALSSAIYARTLRGRIHHLTAVDVHSEKAELIYQKAFALQNKHYFSTIGAEKILPGHLGFKPDIILAPDEGAVPRVTRMAEKLGVTDVRFCRKKRDPKTGKLAGFDVGLWSDQSPADQGKHILISDDICDGGGTFLGIVEAIAKMAYTVKFHLYVTHGIFSNNAIDKLLGLNDYKNANFRNFSSIITTDSFYQGESSDRITVIPLLPKYMETLTP